MEDFRNEYLRKRNNLCRLRMSIAEGCLDKLIKSLSPKEKEELINDINSVELDQREKIVDLLSPKPIPVVEKKPQLNAFELYKMNRGR